jgi:hypothetical protein
MNSMSLVAHGRKLLLKMGLFQSIQTRDIEDSIYSLASSCDRVLAVGMNSVVQKRVASDGKSQGV